MKNSALITIIAVLALSGCSKKLDSILNSKTFHGATSEEQDTETQVEDLPYLSAEEARIAQDRTYLSILTTWSFKSQKLNWEQWPLKCTGAIKECVKDGVVSKDPVGLRDIQISGQVIIIDKSDITWKSLNGARDVRSLYIEADKVIVRNYVNFPGTNLRIVADKVVFEEFGRINLTPKAGPSAALYTEGNPTGKDGESGLDGGKAEIFAGSIEEIAPGDHVVVNGGNGEAAGMGGGQTAAEFAANPDLLTAKEIVPDDDVVMPGAGYFNGNTALRNQIVKQAIFVGKHFNTKYDPQCWRMYPVKHCSILRDHVVVERGTVDWPSDGKDAFPGGYPGAGGNGGSVDVFVKDPNVKLAPDFAVVQPGFKGKPDSDRKGQPAGQPSHAYKIYWKEGDWPGYKIEVEDHWSKNGKDAKSPQEPKTQSSAGSFKVSSLSKFPKMTPSYFDLKLKRIKELYFSRKFNETIQLVNFVDARIKEQDGLTSQSTAMSMSLEKIRRNLIMEKDFYGRGLEDAPAFAFEFNLDQYNAQVKQAMLSYYLAAVFKKSYQDSQAKIKAVNDALAIMESGIVQSTNGLEQTNILIHRIAGSLQNINKNQADVQSDLKQIEEQIKKMAEEEISQRNRANGLLAAVRTAIAICKVVPVWQPALGAAATLFEGMVQPPEDRSTAGVLKHLGTMRDSFDGFYKEENMQKTVANWDGFWGKFDKGHFLGKDMDTKKKWAEGLYKDVKPIVDKVNEATKEIKQPTLGAADVQAEIEKIKKTDVLFKNVAKKLSDLMTQKEQLMKDMTSLVSQFEKLTNQVNDYTLVAARVSADGTSMYVDDGVLFKVFSKMSDDAEARLLFLFDEAVRSYSYVTLEPYYQDLSAMYLRQKMDETLKRTMTTDQAIDTLTAFYTTELGHLKDAMRDKLRESSPLLRVLDASNVIDLSAEELQTLNNEGSVNIELNEEFYQNRSNVKVAGIDIVDRSFGFERVAGEEGRFPAMGLSFKLDKKGSLQMFGQSHTFYYNQPFSWENTFKFQNGVAELERNTNSPTTLGIVGGLLDDPSVLKHSEIFSRHAGITVMKITMDSMKAPYKLKSLSVQVRYGYSLDN